jgi:hypothetical protein
MPSLERLVEIRSQAAECLIAYSKTVEERLREAWPGESAELAHRRLAAATTAADVRRQVESQHVPIDEAPLVVYVDLGQLPWGHFRPSPHELDRVVLDLDPEARPDIATHSDRRLPATILRAHVRDQTWNTTVARKFWRSVANGDTRATICLGGRDRLNEAQKAEFDRDLRDFTQRCGASVAVVVSPAGSISTSPRQARSGAWAAVLPIAIAALTWWCWPRVQSAFTFNDGAGAWGEYVSGETAARTHPGQGVALECDGELSAYAGDCRLAFVPSNRNGSEGYVALAGAQAGALDGGRTIEAQVAVPEGAETCPKNCSTSKIFVWDADGIMRESDYVELVPGGWHNLMLDPRGHGWPEPYRGFGIHVYYEGDGFTGPVFIDNVTVTRRRDWRMPAVLLLAALAVPLAARTWLAGRGG